MGVLKRPPARQRPIPNRFAPGCQAAPRCSGCRVPARWHSLPLKRRFDNLKLLQATICRAASASKAASTIGQLALHCNAAVWARRSGSSCAACRGQATLGSHPNPATGETCKQSCHQSTKTSRSEEKKAELTRLSCIACRLK